MSGWQDRHRRWRRLALAALVALGPALAGAQSGSGTAGGGAEVQTGQETGSRTEPEREKGAGAFLKRLWAGITGKGKHKSESAAEGAPADAASAQGSGPAAPAAPSLASAEWIGFTPVLVVGEAEGAGAWIAGPFPEAGADGWVSDTVSGLTVAVRLVWREAEPGSLARLSAEAARGLGLAPGAVANVAVYRAR